MPRPVKRVTEKQTNDLNALRQAAREKYLREQRQLEEIEEQLQNIDVQPLYVLRDEDEPEFLPNEVMLVIFAYVGHKTLGKTVARVCRGWNFIAMKSNKIWNEYYESFFVRNKKGSIFDTNAVEDSGTFDGTWRKNFVYRYELRNKWRINKPHSIECLDVLKEEIARPRQNRPRDHTFNKDLYLVGQQDEEDTSTRKGYRVDVATRTTVTSLALDGDKLLSGDAAGKIKMFSLRTQQVVKQMSGHQGQIRVLAVDSERRRLYSSADDGNIIVWDLDTSLLVAMIQIKTASNTHRIFVMDIIVDSANKLLYIATPITVEVLDLETREFKFFLDAYPKVKKPRVVRDAMDEALDEDENMDENARQPTILDQIPVPVQDQQQQQQDEGGFDPENSIMKVCVNADADYPRVALCMVNGDLKVFQVLNKSGIIIKNINLKEIVSQKQTRTLGGYVAPTTAPLTEVAPPHVLRCHFENNRPNQLELVLQHVRNNDMDDYYDNSASVFIQVIDIGTGSELRHKRVKLVSTERSQYDYYGGGMCSVYYDDDKIVRSGASEVIVCDRDNGLKSSAIQLPNFTTAGYITQMFCDEKCLVVGTSFGGLVYYDFGGNLTYWKDMTGGQQLGKMDDKADDEGVLMEE